MRGRKQTGVDEDESLSESIAARKNGGRTQPRKIPSKPRILPKSGKSPSEIAKRGDFGRK